MHHLQSIVLTFLFIHLFVFSKAQAVTRNGWFMIVNNYKLDKSFSGFLDVQARSSNEITHLQTLIIRPGLQYHIRKNVIATVGYAYLEHRRTIGTTSGYTPESRIWEQIQIVHPVGFSMLNHRFRLEQRFVSKPVLIDNELQNQGNTYSNRVRYFFRDIIPFNGRKKFDKGLYGALQNEVFINFGDKSTVNRKYFDQNRAYAGIGYRLSSKFDLEAGYLNQYVIGLNKSFTNNHNIQLSAFTRL